MVLVEDMVSRKHAKITVTGGKITIEDLGSTNNQEFMVEMDMSTEALLMDALRQLDEYKRIQGELPPVTSQMTLSMPMTAALRELSPEQLDVLQLVHNYGSMEGVLDHSE